MESTLAENSTSMTAKIVPAPLMFTASPVCRTPQGPLPTVIAKNGEDGLMTIAEFSEKFKLQKWQPILIAQGITPEAFEKLLDNTERFGRHFKYEYDFTQLAYYIVDAPSCQHEYYGGMFAHGVLNALDCHYKETFLVFWNLGAPGVQKTPHEANEICPDSSFWINPEFALVQGERKIPFLVLETAASQTSASLKAKVQDWIGVGVPYVISIDRNDSLKEVKMAIWVQGNEQSLGIFQFGELASLSFKMSKKIISAGFDIQEFENDPKDDEISVSLIRFRII